MTLAPLGNFIAALRTVIAAPRPRGLAAGHHPQARHAGTPTWHPTVARKGRPAGGQPLLQTRHVVPIVTTALLGAVLSVVTWFVVSRWEDRTTELEFSARTSNVALILQAGMNEYFNKVLALRALFSSSARGVTRSEFDGFSQELLRRQTAMLSVSWIPRVKQEGRIEHELAAVRDGIARYHIRSVTADGSLVTSAERNEYFPVYYTSEKERADSIYGLDLGDGGLREEALSRGRDGDRLVASEPIVLQTGTGNRRGFFVLLPVYQQGLPHDTVEERRRNLAGFVQGVFQTSVMIETILRDIKTPLDLYVFAPASGSGEFPIHAHSSSLRIRPIQSKPLDVLTAGPHWLGALDVADRKWLLITVPSESPIAHNWSAWVLLIAGFVVTIVVVAFMSSSGRYALRLIRANERVLELAQTDALTSLANRRAFVDRLAGSFAAIKRCSNPFAVFYIDLDHFKDVNDTLGHQIGDVLLREAAERLKKIVRANDLVARIGGDEFIVLQTDAIDFAALGTFAAKIVETLGAPYIIDSNEIHITASVGISQYSAELKGPDESMMQADLALYRAKEDGRNCFRFHNKQLDQQIRERVTIGEELRLAIGRGELELYYQPKVEIASGEIVGLEALVRWNHPKHGFMAPSLFIPIAERTGSITALGKWVFNDACRQMRLWLDEGIAPQSLAVNLSAVQCKSPDLDRDISESLERWRVNPARMEMELTESVLMEATHEHCDIVERLRKLGLTIAIDDFGTGYSSLNYLSNYPVDRLKIAQELVFRVASDARHATVVRTAIRLALELGIEVIAEGVETAGQALFLVSAGCRYAQGYYFSRPVNVERASTLLRQKRISPSEKLENTSTLTAA